MTTPFMRDVQALLAGAEAAPEVPSVAGGTVRVAAAAEAHVAVRARAEQLVAEANAALAGRGDRVTLADEAGPHALAFTVGYRGRRVRVETRFRGAVAEGGAVDEGDVGPLVLSLLAPGPVDRDGRHGRDDRADRDDRRTPCSTSSATR